ncbi:hypothetical protein AAG570_010800 [Ranatra chinensis]|uniref:Secreted protein n=1 Tax=Ranatra chinensis TaxID=642074 RepID=A0ABD0Z9N9_9HEMI
MQSLYRYKRSVLFLLWLLVFDRCLRLSDFRSKRVAGGLGCGLLEPAFTHFKAATGRRLLKPRLLRVCLSEGHCLITSLPSSLTTLKRAATDLTSRLRALRTRISFFCVVVLNSATAQLFLGTAILAQKRKNGV